MGQSFLLGRKCFFSFSWPSFSDGVSIKTPYGIDVLDLPTSLTSTTFEVLITESSHKPAMLTTGTPSRKKKKLQMAIIVLSARFLMDFL